MALTVGLDFIVVAGLVLLTLMRGFERTLPFFAFVVIVVPGESNVPLPGLFDLTTTRIATATLTILFLAFEQKKADGPREQSLPLKYLMLAYLGWCILSTINSVVFTTSLKTVLSSLLDFYLIYYIYAKAVTSTETVHKILRAFIAALVVCCVFGWFEAYFQWKVLDLFPSTVGRFTAEQGYMFDEGRIRSTFPHSILFANALALGIPCALYLLTTAKSTAQRTYLWVAVMLMFWNIYKTMSRGPWLALILSATLLLLFSPRKVRKYLVVISILTISVCVIRPGVWESIKNTYLESLDPDSPRGGSYQYRYDLMHAARQRLAQDTSRAIWGFGPESFYWVGLEGIDYVTGHPYKMESCDSALVEIMMDTGYVGLLLVIALLLRGILASLRAFAGLPRPANTLCLLFLVNVVAYAFMMLSVQNWGWGQQTHIFWITLALAVTYPRLVRQQNLSAENHILEQAARGDCEPVDRLPEAKALAPRWTAG